MKGSAFLLITCNAKEDDKVKHKLEGIKDVKEVQKVRGIYDIVTKVEASSKSTLKELISGKISSTEGVRSVVVLSKESPLVVA